MEILARDIRQAFRVFRANPLVTAAAVLSLALGIGPNSVLFSVIDAAGFRPLPIPRPDTLLVIDGVTDRGGRPGLSYPDYRDLREGTEALSSVGAFALDMVGVSGEGIQPRIVTAGVVSATYFQTLGVRAAVGRIFREDEDRTPGTAFVALVSDRFWRRQFDADPRVLDRTIRLNNVACAIVGVLPAGFDGTRAIFAPDVWVPAMLLPALRPGPNPLQRREDRKVTVFARLKDGVPLARARAEVAAVGARLAHAYAATNEGVGFTVDYEQATRRAPVAVAGAISLAVAGLILLIACGNVAGLLLGRFDQRRSEIAMRIALGATRARLVRQLLTESLLLSVGGALAGLVLSFWLVRLLPSLVPPMPVAFNLDFRLDLRVMAATLLVAIAAAPAFGLLPALLASRPDVVPLLKGAPRGRGRLARRLVSRDALVAGQIAVSLALLIASTLLVRSFIATQRIDPGFVPRPMVFATMAPQIVGYSDRQSQAFYGRLLERLSAAGGVERATMAKHLPLNSLYGGGARLLVTVPGFDASSGEPIRLMYNIVAPGYFETMGTRIVRGRDFEAGDANGAAAVVLISQSMASRFWGGQDPIGRYVNIAEGPQSRELRACRIVGVVQDTKRFSLTEESEPVFYLPFAQRPAGEMTVIARVAGNATAMTAVFRREVAALDPSMPTLQVTTMESHLRFATLPERVVAIFVGVLGGLGLVMSVVGLYAVVAFLVSRRTREIGIRIAVGAAPGDVVREVLQQGGRLAVAGIAIGILVGGAAMRLLGGSLYGVRFWDPVTYVATSLLVLGVALAGILGPARRAARIDPLLALRSE